MPKRTPLQRIARLDLCWNKAIAKSPCTNKYKYVTKCKLRLSYRILVWFTLLCIPSMSILEWENEQRLASGGIWSHYISWLAWNCCSNVHLWKIHSHGNRTLFIRAIIVEKMILWVYNCPRWPHECLMRCKNCQLFCHLKNCSSIEHLSIIFLRIYW